MGWNSSYGEGEGRYRRSVGNGESLEMIAVAVHGHPCHSSRQDYPDNQDHDTRSAHSFQRCVGDRTSKRCCVG